MATIKCPSNVTSITFATSGVKVPDGSGLVTGLTASEATSLAPNGANVHNIGFGAANIIDTAANGDIGIALPTTVTAITIGGIGYTVTGAVLPFGKSLNVRVPAAAASTFLYQNFILVQG